MKNIIWMAYDLGIRGDYEGIYTWLDKHRAKECGDSLACLTYEFEGDLLEQLKQDIKESVEVSRKTRIYVTWQDPDTHKIKGRFIFGSRKSPPWSGYAIEESDEDVEE